MKKQIFIAFSILLVTKLLFAQGIINNNAKIIISSGAYLLINGSSGNYTNSGTGIIELDGNLSLQGNWINNGSNDAISVDATPEGTVTLNGTSTQDVGGSGKTVFENLTINNANGARFTSNNNTVSGILNFTSGNLNLNYNTVIISNAATNAIQRTSGYFLSNSLDASFNSKVQWNIGTTAGNHVVPYGNGTTYEPIGFNPSGGNSGNVTFSTYPTFAATAALVYADKPTLVSNLYGTTTTNADAANQNGANIVRRFWFVYPSVNPTSAEVSLTYADIEEPINPIDVNNMWQQTYNESTNLWENLTTSNQTSNTTTRVITRTNITDFSNLRIYGVSKNSAPLPIDLVFFNTECMPDGVLINWQTASESNNKMFILEKSFDLESWSAIGKIEGAINSNSIRNYQIFDDSKTNFSSYYRLVQQDNDGNMHIFETKKCQCSYQGDNMLFNVIKNVNSKEITIVFEGKLNENYFIYLTDMVGKRLVSLNRIVSMPGEQRISIPINEYSTGIYLISLKGNYQSTNKKIYLE